MYMRARWAWQTTRVCTTMLPGTCLLTSIEQTRGALPFEKGGALVVRQFVESKTTWARARTVQDQGFSRNLVPDAGRPNPKPPKDISVFAPKLNCYSRCHEIRTTPRCSRTLRANGSGVVSKWTLPALIGCINHCFQF